MVLTYGPVVRFPSVLPRGCRRSVKLQLLELRGYGRGSNAFAGAPLAQLTVLNASRGRIVDFESAPAPEQDWDRCLWSSSSSSTVIIPPAMVRILMVEVRTARACVCVA